MMKYVSVGLLLRRSALNWFPAHLTSIEKKERRELFRKFSCDFSGKLTILGKSNSTLDFFFLYTVSHIADQSVL